MNTLKLLIIGIFAGGLVAACSSSTIKDSDSNLPDSNLLIDTVTTETDSAAVDTPQIIVEENVAAIDHSGNELLIREVYDKFVFSNETGHAAKYFTGQALNKLSESYDVECDDGPCYAFWELRTGEDDGPGSSEVTSIMPQSDGWYVVTYKDMGYRGQTKIKIKEGKIDDYKKL